MSMDTDIRTAMAAAADATKAAATAKTAKHADVTVNGIIGPEPAWEMAARLAETALDHAEEATNRESKHHTAGHRWAAIACAAAAAAACAAAVSGDRGAVIAAGWADDAALRATSDAMCEEIGPNKGTADACATWAIEAGCAARIATDIATPRG